MGVIPSKTNLTVCEKLSVSAFCRRRLAVVLTRLKMAANIKEAATYIEQARCVVVLSLSSAFSINDRVDIRVGPHFVTEPAFHVTRSLEDFVTWGDKSSIRRKVLKYAEQIDDYDLAN